MGEDVLSALQGSGVRLTGPRKAVARTLSESQGWLSVETIVERARRHCPSVGMVTVYRTLDLLEGLGLARRVHGQDGCHGFALAERPHGHYLVCRRCQNVVEFDGCEVERVARRVARQTGFEVEAHMLELIGLCPECVRAAHAGRGRHAGRRMR